MNRLLALGTCILALISCAPSLNTTAWKPTSMTVSYTVSAAATADHPLLAAIVVAGPGAPVEMGRLPWNLEEVERNDVVLTSSSKVINLAAASLANSSQNRRWNVVSSGVSTLVVNDIPANQSAVDDLLAVLDKKFSRVK